MPDTSTDNLGSFVQGAVDFLDALGGGNSDPEPEIKRADADVIDVEAKVVEDPPPAPAAKHEPPPVEARQANGRAFLPSDLAAPLYRLLQSVELLNQDITAARAVGKLCDKTATAWAGWRADLLSWAQDVEAGDWPREDPGAVLGTITRKRGRLPKWRAYVERETGLRAEHSRGTMGAVPAKRDEAKSRVDGMPLLWKLGIAAGLVWGAAVVVPKIIDAVIEPVAGKVIDAGGRVA